MADPKVADPDCAALALCPGALQRAPSSLPKLTIPPRVAVGDPRGPRPVNQHEVHAGEPELSEADSLFFCSLLLGSATLWVFFV